MSTENINPATIRHWPATLGVLAVACLLGTPALAQRPSIANLQAQVAALQYQDTVLQTEIGNLVAEPIQSLNGYVYMDLSTPSRPTLRVEAANLQVVNGLGSSGTVNGLGNVIVGYDEANSSLSPLCSNGAYIDQVSCTNNGFTWAAVHKSGSHNLVIGPWNRYSRYGGLVAGTANTVNGADASVSGGYGNIASNSFASVSGGLANLASGLYSGVGGGSSNTASGLYSSVSGGPTRTVSGTNQWVGGNVLTPQ